MIGIELQCVARAFGGNGFTHWNDSLWAAHAERSELNFTGALQRPQNGKSLRQCGAPRQQTMVAQNDRLLVANAAEQTGCFFAVNGDAFKVMVRNHVVQLRCVEIGLLQTIFQTCHRNACCGVRVHHAMRSRQAIVNGGMHSKASWIDRIG